MLADWESDSINKEYLYWQLDSRIEHFRKLYDDIDI